MTVSSLNYMTGNLLTGSDVNISRDDLYAGTAPVVTNTQQAGSTIASAQKWTPAPVALAGGDKLFAFQYFGGGSFTNGVGVPDSSYILPLSRYPNTYASGQSNWSTGFMYYGQTFEIKYKYIGAATMYRLTINGRRVTDVPVATGGTTPGSSNVLKFDLGSVAVWNIRLDFATMPFGGIFTGPNDSMFNPLPSKRVMILGDSISDGSAQNTGAGLGTWVYRSARLSNINDIWNQSRGGTGYITPGAFTTIPNRVPTDIVPYAPEQVIVFAGYNDGTTDPAVLRQIAAAHKSTIDQIRAGVPGVDVVTVGYWNPSGTVGTTAQLMSDTIKASCFALDVPYIEPITGNVYDVYSNLVYSAGPWVTAGNASVVIGGDSVHPTNAGHYIIGNIMAASLGALTN